MAFDQRGGPIASPTPSSAEPGAAALSSARATRAGARRWRGLVVSLAVGLLVVAVVRSLLVTTFVISGASMQPSLNDGDRVLVSRLERTDLHRGDVVVFDATRAYGGVPVDSGLASRVADAVRFVLGMNADTDHVKRVIGVPGDHVVCCTARGQITVNDQALAEPYLAPGEAPSTVTFDVTVPAGRLWVLGDHRSVSSDSRAHLGAAGGGMVPIDDVVGKVWVRYWPLAEMGELTSATTTPSLRNGPST